MVGELTAGEVPAGELTASQLTAQAERTFGSLMRLVDRVEPDLVFPPSDRDRNVRDVLGHIIAWDDMLLRWHFASKEGITTLVPAPGYSWAQVPQLNQAIWRALQSTSHERACSGIVWTHQQVLHLIDYYPVDQLWRQGPWLWTRHEPIGSYFYSMTITHYQWAENKIRRALRAQKARAAGPGSGPGFGPGLGLP